MSKKNDKNQASQNSMNANNKSSKSSNPSNATNQSGSNDVNCKPGSNATSSSEEVPSRRKQSSFETPSMFQDSDY